MIILIGSISYEKNNTMQSFCWFYLNQNAEKIDCWIVRSILKDLVAENEDCNFTELRFPNYFL